MEYPGMHQGYAPHGAGDAPPNMMPHHEEMHDAALLDPQFDPAMAEMYHDRPPPTHRDYTEMHRFVVDGGNHYGVSATYFDAQDLLWMGNQGGHVTSYYNTDLQKYTSFQVHATDEIRQILGTERGVLFLTKNYLRLSERRGITVLNYSSPNMEDMQCMMLTDPVSLLMGGHQTKLLEYDLMKGMNKNMFEVPEPGVAILRQNNKFIFAGDTGGKVRVYDPHTMRAEHVLDAHSGTLSDFDIHENLLITCGFSNRLNNLTVDRFLMVFDLRVMRAMSPIQVISDPMFLRVVPAYSNMLAVVSQSGHFQMVDTTAQVPSTLLYQVNTHGAFVTCFDISETCEALAFGDSHGHLHTFGSNPHPSFNTYHETPVFADPVEQLQHIHITDDLTPISHIPAMYPGSGTLLSDWPDYLCQYVYRKPKPIDPEILRSMKMYHNTGYAPNPGKERRNQIPYKIRTDKNPGKGRKRNPSVPESPIGRGDDPFISIPKRYRKVEVKYSKLGLEDFDFRFYNKTHFAGLETHIPNAYCNSMLQILYFIEPLRCTLLNHLCEKECCLSCELGFLFHMLDQQKGQTCQASNFLRAFRTIPEAAALGLVLGDIEDTGARVNYPRLIQSWQRFLHQQVHTETMIKAPVVEEEKITEKPPQSPSPSQDERTEQEANASKTSKKKRKKGKKKEEEGKEKEKDTPEPSKEEEKEAPPPPPSIKDEESIIGKLFGLTTETVLRCRCDQETFRDTYTTCMNLSYPDCVSSGPMRDPIPVSLSEVVQYTLTSDQNIQAWCNECGKYQPQVQTKRIKTLPPVLAFNCPLENDREWQFWHTQISLLKQKREEEKESGGYISPIKSNVVSCRYGNACTRKGCKFRHEFDGDMARASNPAEEEFEPRWIPFGLRIRLLEDGRLHIENTTEEDENVDEVYELAATVAHIRDSSTPGGNLVSHVRVSEPYHQRKEGVTCTQWYLLNDFAITPIDKEEAAWFDLDWKTPCVLCFMKINFNNKDRMKVENKYVSEMLLNDMSLLNSKRRKLTFTPLTTDDLPGEGALVALDAEFVSLRQEESELRSDGTRSMIKPSQMTAARITLIRGEGPLLGEPFLDDYIAAQEQVVDYLTEYSGIKPGDLDPMTSTKHVTTLKSSYKKLRYLIDQKVVFVGHGLKKDFRVINIYVPKKQIIDTVELYHLPRQRMISLKFLAWYFLKINIQSNTHDSIEDARTALQLYLKYKEISDGEGGAEKFRTTIKDMYEHGRKISWKIPDIEVDASDNLDACL